MDIKIKFLAECKDMIPIIGASLYKQFADLSQTASFFTAVAENGAREKGLPATFVAFADGIFAGTVTLWRSDLLSRQDITPWLAFLYVKDEFRKNHIGARLQDKLCEYVKKEGFNEVYLYTDLKNYYEKTNWEYIGEGVETDGKIKAVYKKKLL